MNKTLVSNETFLSFEDVLLKPKKTDYSLEDIDISVQLTTNIKLNIPIIASPMDTVCGDTMAIAIGKLGGLGIIHRNQSIHDQVSSVRKVKESGVHVGAAIGITDDIDIRVKGLCDAGVDILCIDYAIGHSQKVIDVSSRIKKKYGIDIISANIATPEAVLEYTEHDISIFRFGTGAGSICISRKISGVGVPQFSALIHAKDDLLSNAKVHIIADGGIKTSGDIVKALAAGATSVMIGSIISATKESPGEIKTVGGQQFKQYRGMGSKLAMAEGSSDRYNQDDTSNFFAEGVVKELKYKGPVEEILENLVYGIKTGLIRSGVKSIEELQDTATFLKVSK